MLGLRFFVCLDCGTAYADVEQPVGCGRCDDASFAELGPGTQAATYFTGR